MDTEKAKSILIVTLSIFLVTATILGAAIVLKQLGVFKQPTVVNIAGSAKESYKPDVAEVNLTVITKDKDSGVAQSKNDEKMSKIIAYLKDSGIKEEDIKTAAYNLYPEYEQNKGGVERTTINSGSAPGMYYPEYYYPNTLKIIGYTLNQSVSFKVRDLSKVGTIIGGLSDKGVSQIDGVYFSLSDEKMEELRSRVREAAVADAKVELEQTKSLYGFKKAKLVSINDNSVYPMPIYRGMEDLKASMASSNTAPIQVGEEELEINVSLTYELR